MTICLKSSFLFIFVFILSLGVEGCGSAQTSKNKIMFEENPPFLIAEAYYQNWVAGIKEGGSGVNVHIIFKSIDPEVVIQNIYFRNQILETKNSSEKLNEYFANLSNNPSSNVVMDIDPIKEAQNTPSQKFQFDLKENEAVMSYTFEDKKHYFKLNHFFEKERIAYPQSNPNQRN